MNKCLSLLSLALCLATSGAIAQGLGDVKIDPPQAIAGQTVTARISLNGDSANCGLRFYWGDGATTDVRIDDKTVLPVTLNHVYAKAGEFRTMAEGKRVGGKLHCTGANVARKVTVAAPAPAPTPVPVAPPAVSAVPAKPVGPACAAPWKLVTRSVNKKTGAYTCTAKSGTALPVARAVCPGDLTYFENAKKGLLGCRP